MRCTSCFLGWGRWACRCELVMGLPAQAAGTLPSSCFPALRMDFINYSFCILCRITIMFFMLSVAFHFTMHFANLTSLMNRHKSMVTLQHLVVQLWCTNAPAARTAAILTHGSHGVVADGPDMACGYRGGLTVTWDLLYLDITYGLAHAGQRRYNLPGYYLFTPIPKSPPLIN